MKNSRVTLRRFLRALCSLVSAGIVALTVVSCTGRHERFAHFELEVTPAVASIANGTSVQLVAMALFADGTKQEVTSSVAWSSSDLGVVLVDSGELGGGLAAARMPGTATITARLPGVQGSMTLTVTSAALVSLEITPAVPSIAKSAMLQFAATGVFTDHSTQDLTQQVVWASSNEFVARFASDAGSAGLATGLDVGNATISATFSGVSATAVLAVTPATLSTIEITPAAPLLPKGTALQLTATGIFSDGTREDLTAQATWQSDDPTVADVSDAAEAKGRVAAADLGQARVSATHLGVSGAASVEVTEATLDSISVAPAMPTLAKGTELSFRATGSFSDGTTRDLTAQAIWESSDPAVCALSNAPGNEGGALALEIGSATISARLADRSGATQLSVTEAALDSIVVTPMQPTIANGTTVPFRATGNYTDGSHQDLTAQVTWTSSDRAVAVVSNADGSQGFGSAMAVGTATISAQLAGKSGSTVLTVSAATLVSIELAPQAPTIAKGTFVQFAAIGVYTDGSTQDLSNEATWSSSSDAVARISNAADTRGNAQGEGVGSATISAAFAGTSDSTTLTVTDAALVALSVSPAGLALPLGTMHAFVATALFSDGSLQDVTGQASWTSSDNSVSTVSSGVARANAYGSVAIGATLQGISASANLTVTAATLISIAIAPADPTIAQGYAVNLVATGTYSDASTLDLTGQATWSSSDPSVATVSSASADAGRALGIAAGQATIYATLQGISASTLLTVDPKVLVSVEIAPLAPSVPKSFQWQFAAIGHFSDGSTQDFTALVGWDSSDSDRASISNAAGSNGLATCGAPGVCTISFVYQSFFDATSLTVTHAKPVSTVINPSSVTLAVGQTLQLSALTTFDDGTVIDVTRQRHWTCSHANCVRVDNGGPTEGLVTGLAPGQSDVMIHVGGANASVQVTVY